MPYSYRHSKSTVCEYVEFVATCTFGKTFNAKSEKEWNMRFRLHRKVCSVPFADIKKAHIIRRYDFNKWQESQHKK